MRLRFQFVIAWLCVTLLSACNLFLSPDARVMRAQELIDKQDYRAAAIELKNALRSDSSHTKGRLLLAQVSLELGDVASAEKELRRAVELGAAANKTAPLTAEIQLALGQAGEVLKQLDAGELQLAEPQRSFYRGTALLHLQQPEQAIVAFNTALAHSERDARTRLALAEAFAAQGRLDAAAAEIDAVLKSQPQAAEAHLARGTLYAKRGRFSDAEAALRAAERFGSTRLTLRQRAALYASLIEVQLARGDLHGAHRSQQQLEISLQDAPMTRFLSARIATAEQDYVKAVAELQKVLAVAPDFVPARLLLGAVSVAQGSMAQAEQHLLQVVQQAPEDIQARKLLAQVQLRLQRPAAALATLESTAGADEQRWGIDALRGLAHVQSGARTKGQELLERSVADNPGNRQLKLELAAVYLRNGAYAQAIEMMRQIEHITKDAARERILLTALAAERGLHVAQAEAESLASSYPNESAMLNLVSSFFASHGDVARARSLLDRATTIQPRDISTLINRARVEAMAGDEDASARWLQRVLEIEPKNSQAAMMLADVALRRGDEIAAKKWFEQARASDANAVEPRLQLARVYLRERRKAEADALLQEVLLRHPNEAEPISAVGAVCMEAGRYSEALDRFRIAADLAPGDPLYRLNIARAQLALGYGAVAREVLDEALAMNPRWLPAVSTLSLLDVSEGKSTEALRRVSELKRALPQNADVFTLEGDVYLAQRRFAEAARSFDAAWSLEPSAPLALKLYRARQIGGLNDPVSPLQKWLKKRPSDLAIRSVLADAYRLAGQRDDAIEEYEAITRASPADVQALNNLAWLYHENGDPRAESAAKQAYTLARETPAIADTYGWILVQAGRAGEAVGILREAARQAKNHPDINYHYAAALAATGASEEARHLLSAVLERPESFASRADAERLLARLLTT